MTRVIGIGGISRSGKSFLAEALCREISRLKGSSCRILHQDEFTRAEQNLPVIRGHIDWEIPSSIDFDRLKSEIESHRNKFAFIIVEGLLVFADPDLNQLFNKRLFIDLEKDEFAVRKKEDLRWGPEPDWYIEHIWNAHKHYGQLPIASECLRINGNDAFQMGKITEYILH